MSIIWKPVYKYDGIYEVSSDGQIRSLSRTYEERTAYPGTNKKRVRNHTGRILKQYEERGGYLQCYLSKYSKVKSFLVHRVVWEAFKGEIPKTYQIDHINSDKKDNRIDNLRCVSRREHGKISTEKGELKNNNRKLTKESVIEIKKLLQDEAMSYKSIADKFNVHRSTIQAIYTGKSWSHVGLDEQSEYDRGYQDGYKAAQEELQLNYEDFEKLCKVKIPEGVDWQAYMDIIEANTIPIDTEPTDKETAEIVEKF